MAKQFKITKGSFSRREDGKGNAVKKGGKFVRYSARSEKNIISMEEKTYLHLKERLGLKEHVVKVGRKKKADPETQTGPETQTNEGDA